MKNSSKNMSIVDNDLEIDGSIVCKGSLIIRGSVKGTLKGEKVVIAEEGRLYADARVSSLTIGGMFEGDLTATGELIILSSGSCTGKVLCRSLSVESGGILNASVTYMKPGKAEMATNKDKGRINL